MALEFHRHLILASRSPRRKQLLEAMGLQFEIRSTDVAETFPQDIPPERVAEFLARKKANAARAFLTERDEVILTADSVVLLDDKIYEKPENREDALRILGELSGRQHAVITGVCLLDARQVISFSDTALVQFKPLQQHEMEYYVDKFQPYDKAGAYAIQEWIGLCKVSRLEGTYANVMGLPVHRIYEVLPAFS